MLFTANHLQRSERRAVRHPGRVGRGNIVQHWQAAAGLLGFCSPYRPTRRLDRHDPLAVFRARLPNEAGPGCYILKTALAVGSQPSQPSLELAAAQLRREAEVARQVEHRNLTTVLDILAADRSPALVLPYRDGASLRQVLDWWASRPVVAPCGLPLWWVAGVLRQVAAALATLHQAGWLHGQVRPEHILIHPSGYACLIDLTGARRLHTPECAASGGFPGAWAYAAPEWGSQGRLVTGAADIYALGCMLWECLTGRPPFMGATAGDAMRLHRRAAVPALRVIRPDVGWEAEAVVRQMLAKEPLRRPTAQQVEQWLAEIAVETFACGCLHDPAYLMPRSVPLPKSSGEAASL